MRSFPTAKSTQLSCCRHGTRCSASLQEGKVGNISFIEAPTVVHGAYLRTYWYLQNCAYILYIVFSVAGMMLTGLKVISRLLYQRMAGPAHFTARLQVLAHTHRLDSTCDLS